MERTEFPVDGIAILCQTASFQQLVFEILDAVVPKHSAALQNLRDAMFHWTSVDERIIHSSRKPSADQTSTIPGVPVALLPFVLDHVPAPDVKDPDFKLMQHANNMLCELWAVIQDLQEQHVPLQEVPPLQDDVFVTAVHDFFTTYANYTSTLHVTDMLAMAHLE